MTKMHRFILAIFTFISFLNLNGQDPIMIKATVSFEESGEKVAYANVFNYSTIKGTITNDEGYFALKANALTDSVVVSYIGYEDFTLNLNNYDGSVMQILLKASATQLEEVTINPEEDGYLFDLIEACRKRKFNEPVYAKAYYGLKSYMDSAQIELVEGYYNVGGKGYDLEWMDLKTGRLALNPNKDRLFTSLESSRTFTMLDLMQRDIAFPAHPFNLKKRKLRKSYYLYLDGKYEDVKGDSVYIISFNGKQKSKTPLFSGTVWLNKTKETVKKIEYYCDNCSRHPFIPLFPSDKIRSVDMFVRRTFYEDENGPYFNHVDFDYNVDYLSRSNEDHEYVYKVSTKAVLYAYDFMNYFSIPYFDFNAASTGDFRKINAIPYNPFFWKFNDEYKINNSNDENNVFFNEISAINNKNIFKNNPLVKTGMFQHPYIKWSDERIFFKEFLPDTVAYPDMNFVDKSDFNFEVKVFLDINTYEGKSDILTATIFDPYESWYYRNISILSQCISNMYFDLCEIMRRKLHLRLRASSLSQSEVDEIYDRFKMEYEDITNRFLDEVDMGENKEAVEKWNAYINQYLEIDNLAIFTPYKDEEVKEEK